MPTELTERQAEVLSWIALFSQQKGYPPTIREIGDHFDISSTNGVRDHLKALRKKEYVDWEDDKKRTIRVIKRPDDLD